MFETNEAVIQDHIDAFTAVNGLDGTACTYKHPRGEENARANMHYFRNGREDHIGLLVDDSSGGGISIPATVNNKYGFTPIVLPEHIQRLLRERFGDGYREVEALFYACRLLSSVGPEQETVKGLVPALQGRVRELLTSHSPHYPDEVVAAAERHDWECAVEELRPRVRRSPLPESAIRRDDVITVLAALNA